jgi:hypothetical protein
MGLRKKGSYFLELKAEFKGRPKVFEVTIADYQEVIETTPMREKVAIPDAHSRKIRSEFWNKSKIIFDEIVKRKEAYNGYSIRKILNIHKKSLRIHIQRL